MMVVVSVVMVFFVLMLVNCRFLKGILMENVGLFYDGYEKCYGGFEGYCCVSRMV